MRRITPRVLVWIVSATCVALSGCGSGHRAVEGAFVDRIALPGDTMTTRVSELGRYGGRFVIAQPGAPKTFNAILANETSSTDITALLFVGLSAYDNARQTMTPMLARTWDVSPDGCTWTFHMRRGVAFSDGHPITSEDALFGFSLVYDEALHPSLRELLTMDGKPFAVSAPDSYTVVVTSPRPYALMLPAVGSVSIMPKHVLGTIYAQGGFASAYPTTTAPESIVTSGPWRVAQVVPNEKVVLTRNPYWFGVDPAGHRLPYLDQLVFLIVADQNTATLKFQAGEADAIDNIKSEDYPTLAAGQASGGYTLYDLGPGLNTNFFWFNLNRVRKPHSGRAIGAPCVDPIKYAWFSDVRFRHAVSKAIDRKAIIESVMFGEGVPNWSPFTAGNRQWYDSTLAGDDYDPAGAGRLLAAMGCRDRNGDGVLEDAGGHPISFTLKTNASNNTRVQMCNFIKDDLAKVGIRCTPVPLEFNSLVVNLREDFQYDAMLLGLGSAVPPDPGMGANVYLSSGLTHYWNISQPSPETPAEAAIDRLFAENVGTQDMAIRRRSYHDLMEIWNQQTYTVWLPSLRAKVPISNRFGNLEPSVVPHRILWNVERVFVKPGATH